MDGPCPEPPVAHPLTSSSHALARIFSMIHHPLGSFVLSVGSVQRERLLSVTQFAPPATLDDDGASEGTFHVADLTEGWDEGFKFCF